MIIMTKQESISQSDRPLTLRNGRVSMCLIRSVRAMTNVSRSMRASESFSRWRTIPDPLLRCRAFAALHSLCMKMILTPASLLLSPVLSPCKTVDRYGPMSVQVQFLPSEGGPRRWRSFLTPEELQKVVNSGRFGNKGGELHLIYWFQEGGLRTSWN